MEMAKNRNSTTQPSAQEPSGSTDPKATFCGRTAAQCLCLPQDHPLRGEADRLIESLFTRVAALHVAIRGIDGGTSEQGGLAWIAREVDSGICEVADFIEGPNEEGGAA